MKVFFVTGNKHKLEEAKLSLSSFGIEVEGIDDEKYEPKDRCLQEVAKYNAEEFYKKYKKPIIVDDTGVFFDAYPKFPGSNPKLVFDMLGYKGLLKLLEDESRKAYFNTVIAFCDGETALFEGKLDCEVSTVVHDPDKDVMPYMRIMLFEGRPLSNFSKSEKDEISHRAKAFRQLGEFLNKRRNNPV